MDRTVLQAHRGVSTDYPENTMAAFIGSVVQGYPIIEMDPMYTKDGEIVLLHDRTLNRTARNRDGSKLEQPVALPDLTYAEALNYDYGIWFGEKFRGEPLPLLADVLRFAGQFNVDVKIDNKIQSFPPEMLEKLFTIVENSHARVGITSSELSFIKMVHARLPEADIHYDGIVTEEILQELCAMIPGEKLVVWLPYPTPHNTWVRIPFVSEELTALVKKYARLGLWILSEHSDYRDAVTRFHPYVVETTGNLKPSNTADIV